MRGSETQLAERFDKLSANALGSFMWRQSLAESRVGGPSGQETAKLEAIFEEFGMAVRDGMPPVHPGEILADELRELGMSAKALGVPANRVTAILNGQRGISADTALRLARYFGTTPRFWLNLQQTFELRTAEIASGAEIEERVQPHREAVESSAAWAGK